jgi:hypothetical protein
LELIEVSDNVWSFEELIKARKGGSEDEVVGYRREYRDGRESNTIERSSLNSIYRVTQSSNLRVSRESKAKVRVERTLGD